MTFTLLLDLDDTLLDTNMDAFAPEYFKALSAALASEVAPEVMLPALMDGTRAMMSNADPALTLRQVFDERFFPRLGLERSRLQEKIDRFYDEGFPALKRVTRSRPQAVDFVEWAFAAGHRVVVATNPLFPLKAIHHRLRWAGVPPERFAFALVSSYETFHFSKETIAYFPELLAQLGWPEDPAIMIGNDPDMDLLPAQKAGFPVFWVHDGADGGHPDLPRGTFADLRTWLEAARAEELQPAFHTPDSILSFLRSTPAALATMTVSLPAERWQERPAPGEWCLTEIVCHLRDVEIEINLVRIRKALEEESPFLPGVVSDRWVEERNYAAQDGPSALTAFTEARKQALALLGGAPEGWSRTARHAIFGPTTLQELVSIVAGHDRAHLQQVRSTLASPLHDS
jgi:FMN phosphatase YigB (HAD superfamily)